MSRENVEVAKRVMDAYNRRGVDSFVEVATADFELSPALPGIVEGEGYAGYRGREGLETFFRDSRRIWEDIRTVAEEFRDLGDRVLVLGRVQGRGTVSGAPVDAPIGIVIDFRDGKISRARGFLDHGEALQVARLSE